MAGMGIALDTRKAVSAYQLLNVVMWLVCVTVEIDLDGA